MKITVETIETKARDIKKKDGTPMSFRNQEAWAHLGLAHPQRIELALWDNAQPYAIGEYTLDTSSFTVGRYGNLELKRSVTLAPIGGKGVK